MRGLQTGEPAPLPRFPPSKTEGQRCGHQPHVVHWIRQTRNPAGNEKMYGGLQELPRSHPLAGKEKGK